MIDLDRDLDGIADTHDFLFRLLALLSDGQRSDVFVAGLGLADLDFYSLRAADDAKTRRCDYLEAAIELVIFAGKERMHRSIKAQSVDVLRHVMHLAVGNHDDASQAVWRNVREGLP